MGQVSGADLVCGIRPLIYHMIREDLIAETEIRLCRRRTCDKFFRADRIDQTCCSPECSQRVRFQKYYETKRKPTRQAKSKVGDESKGRSVGGEDVPGKAR